MKPRSSACLLSLALAAWTHAATLTVRVEGLRNTKGFLRLALFNAPEGYPEEIGKARRTLTLDARDSAVAVFEGLAPGDWALSVLHDENGNGRLDRNVLGIPSEGYTASHGAEGRFGRPKFQDARFSVPEIGLVLQVTLRYWTRR